MDLYLKQGINRNPAIDNYGVGLNSSSHPCVQTACACIRILLEKKQPAQALEFMAYNSLSGDQEYLCQIYGKSS